MTIESDVSELQDAPKATAEDLSSEIAATVEKDRGDRVRCTRVSGNNYRCNWWSLEGTTGYDNPGMDGLVVTTHRVRKSRFLSATKVSGKLVIVEHPRSGATVRMAHSG